MSMSLQKGLTLEAFEACLLPAECQATDPASQGGGEVTGGLFRPKSHPVPPTKGQIRPLKILLPFLVKLSLKGLR